MPGDDQQEDAKEAGKKQATSQYKPDAPCGMFRQIFGAGQELKDQVAATDTDLFTPCACATRDGGQRRVLFIGSTARIIEQALRWGGTVVDQDKGQSLLLRDFGHGCQQFG